MKKINLSALVAGLALLALFAGNSNSLADNGAPVEMKYKWTVGKRYDQAITMSQETTTVVPGMDKPMEQTLNMTQEFSMAAVKARPTGGTELEMTFSNIKMEQKMAGQSLNFDSHKDSKEDAGNPAAPMLRKLAGAHVKYLTGADGKVEKLVGYQEFIDQIAGGDAQLTTIVKSMFSEDTLKQMGVSGQGLPTKPVSIGDTWPFHMEIAIGPLGVMTLDMKLTFKGWEDRGGYHCAVLEWTGVMKNKPDATAGAMKVEIEKGTSKGTMWFEPKLGAMVDNITDQLLTLKIQAQGQDITSNLKQRIQVQLVKIADAGK